MGGGGFGGMGDVPQFATAEGCIDAGGLITTLPSRRFKTRTAFWNTSNRVQRRTG